MNKRCPIGRQIAFVSICETKESSFDYTQNVSINFKSDNLASLIINQEKSTMMPVISKGKHNILSIIRDLN